MDFLPDGGEDSRRESAVDLKSLHAKLGAPTLEYDFFPARSQKRDHDLSIVRQTIALGVARSSVYDKSRPVSAEICI